MLKKGKKLKILLVIFVFLFSITSTSFQVLAQNVVQEIFKGDTNSKVIALTFDDCYNTVNTSAIVDVLSNNNIKGTFFPVGYVVMQNPDIFSQAYSLGNQIGNHTYTHPHLNQITYDEIITELNEADSIIMDATGQTAKPYIRPPYFDYNDIGLQAFADTGNTKLIRCTIDSMDWNGVTSAEITQNVLSQASPGSIILFHDMDNTVTALPNIISSLKAQGYKFVTVAGLLSYVSAESVSLNRTSEYLDIGQRFNLQATVYPENATEKGIVWNSSNDYVATVDSAGQVTGLANGNATITATTVDLGYTAKCSVSVGITNDNLAAGKSVSSSAVFTNKARITDSDKSTGNYADSYPNTGLQWVQVDLGSSRDINNIKLWHYFGDARRYNDVIVQVSNNSDFSSGVTTLFNNDNENSSGLGKGTDSEYTETSSGLDITFNTVNARYARFYTNGSNVNSWNHYVEVEIFNNPNQIPNDNLAAGKSASSSAVFTNKARITDSDKNTDNYADSYPNTGLQWVQLDLGSSRDINNIKLWHYFGDSRIYHDVVVQLSNSADFSSGVTTLFNNDINNSSGLGAGTDSEYTETSSGLNITFNAVNARYARFYTNGSNVNGWNHYVEVEIFNNPNQIPNDNLVAGKSVSSSAAFTNKARITDSDKNTDNYADSYPNTGLQWVQLDLGSSTDINNIKLWHYFGDSRIYNDVVVQLSNNADFSSGVTTLFNNDIDNSSGLGAGTDSKYTETSSGLNITFSTVNARYARFYTNGSNVNGWNHYVEIEMYNIK